MTDPSAAIRLTRLPSGLTVVTERMERVETVSFGAYVAAGTRNETDGRRTASRISSNTWPSRAPSGARAAQIAEEIEAVGGHINAYTAREQTAYLRQGAEGGHWRSAPTSSATS